MVGEGDARLQPAVHAGSVHAVQQRLHEPAHVQEADLPPSLFVRRFAVEAGDHVDGFPVPEADVVVDVEPLDEVLAEQDGPGGQVLRPGEAVGVQQVLAVEPRVAAEDLVRALAGQGDLVVLLDERAEVQQRPVHVRHPRQVLGAHGVEQRVYQAGVVALQVGVVQVVGLQHPVHVRPVAFRLKGVGLEVPVVLDEIEREGVQLPALLLQVIRGQRRHDAGVDPAGKEGAHGNVRDHLPGDGVAHQVRHGLHGPGIAVRMLARLKRPVGRFAEPFPRENGEAAGPDLTDILEDAAPRRPCGSHAEDLPEGVHIHLRGNGGVAEQRLDLGPEDQRAVPDGVEQRLHARAVAAEHQALQPAVPDGGGENPVQLFRKAGPVFHVGVQDDLRVGRGPELVPGLLQLRFQFVRVVDLAVVDDGVVGAACAPDHRLAAARNVPDGKPRMGKPHVGAQIFAGLVAPAAGDRGAHVHQDPLPPVGVQ